MNDDLDQRLRKAFRHAPLPAAPASLVSTMERVPDAPVATRRGRRGRSVWVPLAVAAVLVVAGAAIVGGGRRAIVPAPTAAVSPEPSTAASAPADGLLHIEYQVEPVRLVKPTAADVDVIVSIVEHRLTSLGLAGSTVRAMAADRFLVELSTTIDTQAARDLIGQTGHLDFVPLGTTQMQVGDVVDPAKFPALFSGDQVETAATENDPTKGRIVTFVLKSEGATLFGDYTAGHVGQYFAIALDSKVISAPTINQAIPGGHVEISSGGIGGYPLKEAQDLVAILQFGELPFPIVELSNEVVSPGPTTP
jgi:hypothetical protein